MNTYIYFYGNKTGNVEAASSYSAQTKVAELLKIKPNQQYKISVHIVEKEDGEKITHLPLF
jgi:hypothetical protein